MFYVFDVQPPSRHLNLRPCTVECITTYLTMYIITLMKRNETLKIYKRETSINFFFETTLVPPHA